MSGQRNDSVQIEMSGYAVLRIFCTYELSATRKLDVC